MAVHRFMTGCEEVKVCLPIDDEVLSKLLSVLQPVFPLTPWHRCISALVSSPDTNGLVNQVKFLGLARAHFCDSVC